MTFKRLRAAAILAVAALTLSACNDSFNPKDQMRYDARATYFEGAVAVEYRQVSRRTNDYLSVVFYAPGTYSVAFSVPPGDSTRHASGMPNPYTVTITTPREILVTQKRIPDFIRVAITRDGVTESHDFQ